MKRFLLILSICTVLCVCGCKSGENAPPPVREYPPADTHGTNAVYVNVNGSPVPIALVKNGVSVLAGDNYYYNVSSLAELDSPQIKLTFSSDGTVTDGVAEYPDYEALYSSGNWEAVKPARHAVYAEGDSAGDGYAQFVAECEGREVSEVNVSEIFEYDYDGDGSNEAVIVAKTGDKTMTVLQSQTFGCRKLADSRAYVYFADLDGNGKPSLTVIHGDKFKLCDVYRDGTLELIYTVYLPIEKR